MSVSSSRASLLLLCLGSLPAAACATQQVAAPASDLVWLFSQESLDGMPVEGSSGEVKQTKGTSFAVPPSFEVLEVSEVEPALAGRHRASGAEFRLELARQAFPGHTEALRFVLSRMQAGFESLSDHHAHRIEFLGSSGAITSADLDGVSLDGLAWWTESGLRLFVKVRNRPPKAEERQALHEDLRVLLSATALANAP